MRVLLDSQALFWAIDEADKLSEHARRAILGESNVVFYSPLSFYELMFKANRGRAPNSALQAPTWVEAAGFQQLPLTATHFIRAALLDWTHGDPWDRIIYAQAMLEDMHIVSADRVFDQITERRIW